MSCRCRVLEEGRWVNDGPESSALQRRMSPPRKGEKSWGFLVSIFCFAAFFSDGESFPIAVSGLPGGEGLERPERA